MAKVVVWLGNKRREIDAVEGMLVSEALAQSGIHIDKPCAGRGTCGKCAVLLKGTASEETNAEKRLGTRLACQARITGDCEIFLPSAQSMRVETETGLSQASVDPMPGSLGLAVDIGTTTLAAKLYDLAAGTCLATVSRLNPQTSVSSDVMGRISAAMEGGLNGMRDMIVEAVKSLTAEACEKCSREVKDVASFVAAGNTTMLYLLTGRDPVSLSRAPFEADCLFDFYTDVLGGKCYLPPCMNAFVGADIVCAALACGMCDKDETSLLCDIGTNGEIALWHSGTLYVTSTAAGPAFEGAGISCGAGSVEGAIDKVGIVNGRVWARAIGGKRAVGLCGSGLIDAVAAFLNLGDIDETGATECDTLEIADAVYLIPADIRAVQLAKAAIAAGIVTLLKYAGVSECDVKKVYLAGGFGSHIDIASAARIGLIPIGLAARVEAIGNASLAGAAGMLLDRGMTRLARMTAAKSKHVNLGGNPVFNENYIERMMFPEAL